jgi:hypothetical protein
MYDAILSTLYDKYFLSFSGHSKVTSSHWQQVGSQQVAKDKDLWLVKGEGFGNFLDKNITNQIFHAPELILSEGLLQTHHCPQKILQAGKSVADSQNRLCEFDCVKQMLSVFAIAQQLKIDLSSEHPFTDKGVRVACVIGDGYGYFTLLLKALDPDLKIITVNLGRTLLFDVLFAKKRLPQEESRLIDSANSMDPLVSLNFCEAEHYEILRGMPVDLFVNIASMQEMNPVVINTYFEYMRASSSEQGFFYCCNRIKKILPDGTITQFSDYPWGDAVILLDELCPWYQEFPVTTPPFWKKFDGPTQHRFVRLK